MTYDWPLQVVGYYVAWCPQHLHFYLSTFPNYSSASMTFPFYVPSYLTKIFLLTLNISISMYQLVNQAKHSCSPSTAPFWCCVYLAKIFLLTSTSPFLRIYWTKIFLLTLVDTSILSTYPIDSYEATWLLLDYIASLYYWCPFQPHQPYLCLRN